MPLDDLDDFLAMELTPTKSHKVAKQVDSLEALVLSRVQEVCPPEERHSQLDSKPIQPETDKKEEIDPLHQFVEILWPTLNTLQDLLANTNAEFDKNKLAQQRSELADQLLALPEIKGLDKAGIFAAVAACMDAISSTKLETRISALNRIKNLYQTLIAINKDVKQQKITAMNNFLNQLL
jgi:hypothetical protein